MIDFHEGLDWTVENQKTLVKNAMREVLKESKYTPPPIAISNYNEPNRDKNIRDMRRKRYLRLREYETNRASPPYDGSRLSLKQWMDIMYNPPKDVLGMYTSELSILRNTLHKPSDLDYPLK